MAVLREEHGFRVGHAEAHDALRGIETLGLHSAAAVRCALRAVCCSSPAEIGAFERAFEAYFLAPVPGLPQPGYEPRHTRPAQPGETPAHLAAVPPRPPADPRNHPQDDDEGNSVPAARREAAALEDRDDASPWQALRARYSADPGGPEPVEIDAAAVRGMLDAADRTIAAVRLGRSRRRRPMARGPEFDLRRTLRRSLHTGGDPVALQRLGHSPRNPRFAILIDGSRSMLGHGAPMLAFAAALCRRSRRSRAFVFSTELRDVTRELRRVPAPARIEGLGAAWGGGTRIGRSLLQFARERGSRLLADDAVVFVFSDGLDVGEPEVLRRAMSQIARRAALVIWLNPHAGAAGFAPSARGMRVALPYVSLLAHAHDARDFRLLARRISLERRS